MYNKVAQAEVSTMIAQAILIDEKSINSCNKNEILSKANNMLLISFESIIT